MIAAATGTYQMPTTCSLQPAAFVGTSKDPAGFGVVDVSAGTGALPLGG